MNVSTGQASLVSSFVAQMNFGLAQMILTLHHARKYDVTHADVMLKWIERVEREFVQLLVERVAFRRK